MVTPGLPGRTVQVEVPLQVAVAVPVARQQNLMPTMSEEQQLAAAMAASMADGGGGGGGGMEADAQLQAALRASLGEHEVLAAKPIDVTEDEFALEAGQR